MGRRDRLRIIHGSPVYLEPDRQAVEPEIIDERKWEELYV